MRMIPGKAGHGPAFLLHDGGFVRSIVAKPAIGFVSLHFNDRTDHGPYRGGLPGG